MKKFIYSTLIAFLPLLSIGQVTEKQTNQGDLLMPDSTKNIIPIGKQTLIKDVDMFANTRFSYQNNFTNGVHDYSAFKGDEFRLEIRGKIHEKVYFRFRNKYTATTNVGTIDGLLHTIDMAFVRFDVSPKTKIEFGKTGALLGGYEFDFNPIDIIAYNDLFNNADIWLTGAGISHELNKKHNVTFQVMNSRSNKFRDQYGVEAPADLQTSKFALAVVGNWNGSFFDNKFQTSYGYSFFNEAKGAAMNFVTLGHKFQPNKRFVAYYDFKYTFEGLDRTGIITRIVNNNNPLPVAVNDASYFENWIRAEWLVTPKVNLILSAMNSNHFWYDNPVAGAGEKLATSYGLIPTIQYLPYKNLNLKLYMGLVYRNYQYTDFSKNTYGVKDYSNSLLSFGVIAPLQLL